MSLLIGQLVELFQESAKRLRTSGRPEHTTIACAMDEYCSGMLVPLWRCAQRNCKHRFTLSFVGLTNTGKSTLIQALFGHPLAPVRNGPATAIPVEYDWAPQWCMTVIPTVGMTTRDDYLCTEALLKALEVRVLAPEGRKVSGIEKVIAHGPLPLLIDGLVLADTPGFGAADPDSDATPALEGTATEALVGTHDDVLVKYLMSDHVDQVFYCVSGRNAHISPLEVEFYKRIQEKVSHVIITKAGEFDRAAAEEYRIRYQPVFNRPFIFVEARLPNTGKVEKSNIPELQDVIRDYCTAASRVALVDKEAREILRDFSDRMKHLLRIPICRDHWHPTFWELVQETLSAKRENNL